MSRRVRVIFISVATAVVFACASLVVLVLGSVLPSGLVNPGIDRFEGRKQQAVIESVAEMGQRGQAGMGTYRVTAWRVTSVKKCATRCPRPYSVEVDLYTVFGIPLGETGLHCGAGEFPSRRRS